VLVGQAGECDTMLSSPIILYDYPRIATQSPGDFFDGTEIDEMLVLRILTLTPEERQAAAAVDDRARALMERTYSLSAEQVMGLHGAIRGLRPSGENRHE
jgi:hydrogenase maturation protease